MTHLRTAALVLVLVAIGAGCGSDSSDESNGLESKSAEEILDETVAALKKVKSFHLEGSDRSGDVKADIGLPAKLRLALSDEDTSVSMLVVDGAFYMKGNAAYWKSLHEKRAADLGDRWIQVPGSLAKELTTALDPETLSGCLAKDHGTIEKGGTATVGGQRAVVIVDKGDRPGTAPGKLYVAAEGDPLPLRTLTTGKERPGGRKDPDCGDDTPDEPGDTATLSNYNQPFDVSEPPAAIDLSGTGTGTAS